jgi:predicted acyltransferase
MDIRHQRSWWTTFFVIFGTNAIAAYVLSELIGLPLHWLDYIFQQSMTHSVSDGVASLLYSLTVVGLCFLPVWWMYRRKIFLKA